MGIFTCCECDRFAYSREGCAECPKHQGGLICQDCLDNRDDDDNELDKIERSVL